MASKTQRVRDPIHGLIGFESDNEIDQLAWRLLDTREFQRIRRIKQLGFSELVFPGATHTRFAHCVGVFHNARRLLEIIRRKIKGFDEGKARTAAVAALLHDIGHGPFSHTFEGVQKDLGEKRHHESWSVEIISKDTNVHEVLDEFDASLATSVSELLQRTEPRDIYDAIVSSQFDADRLDYLACDRYMSGIGTGGVDFLWLLDCLEVGDATVGLEGEDFATVPILYLNYKALQAAEGYLLARFHLYSQVYLHKTTRAAERMLATLLASAGKKVRAGDVESCGLSAQSKLVQFFQGNPVSLEGYLALDDTVLWASINEMANARDASMAALASRLRDRRLYKCLDVGALSKSVRSDSVPRFRKRLNEAFAAELNVTILTDQAPLSAYGIHDYDDPGALKRVLLGRADGTNLMDDIAERSTIVKSIPSERIFRVYADEDSKVEALRDLWKEVIK